MGFPARIEYRDAGDVAAALAWVAERREALEARLREAGALLVRGLPLAGADDFDAFVRGFDWPVFAYRESLSNAVRIERTDRVFTANEAPPEATIRLHHELAQTPVYPARLFFFCEKPAEEGGATPLCRSDRLFERLERARPDFTRDCEKRGLLYQLVMPPEDDAGSGQGRSWRSTFATTTRDEAEARMRRLGYAWTWLPDDCLRATTPVLPAVRTLPDGRKSFFNQLVATLGWGDARNRGALPVTFGDGGPLDPEALALAGSLAEELAVDLRWQRGDVALVDNFVVMHGRRSFRGTRRVLASLAGAP